MASAADRGIKCASGLQRGAWSLLLVGALLVAPARSDAASYKVLVDSAEGPLADVFLELVTLQISYTLDESVADANGGPQDGTYPGAVLELSVDILGIRSSVIAGPAGTAEVSDNVDVNGQVSDQAVFSGGPIASTDLPGGEQVTSLELALSASAVPPAVPGMLDSDVLPTGGLRYGDGVLVLETIDGDTTVRFSPVDSIEDDGCAIAVRDRSGRGMTWLLAIAPVMWWARRRQAQCSM
jgi:hypothetical protein